jgi:hypothetical protein
MVQRRDGAGLRVKRSRRTVSRATSGWSTFQGNVTTEPGIVGTIHLAHTAGTEQRADFVNANAGAGSEGHR